jgi:hypothetical protein
MSNGRTDGIGRLGQPWRVVLVAAFNLPHTVREVLHEVGMQHATLVRFNIGARPPVPDELLRFEDLDGSALTGERIGERWHHPPYALPLKLVRYAPLSAEREVLDVAVISTRGKRSEFVARIERTAGRLVEDAIIGASRGDTQPSLDTGRLDSRYRLRSGRIDHAIARWRTRLFSEWWSVGMTARPLADIVQTGSIGPVGWLSPARAARYLADPFPWPGTDRLLCEEMPFRGGNGRIVALSPGEDGSWRSARVVLEKGEHHSYPCVVRDGEIVYFLPEATSRGATTLYRLTSDENPTPVAAVAPGRRLADPTLFKSSGRYWIACTDLDIGSHDNLCLLHAREPSGPWRPHRCTPVKIDVCGARPAGPVFRLGPSLFRPGQDCARTYGAALVIHRIDALSPEHYSETVVTRLHPDPTGPFPDGLHTLAADQHRVWVDGKRLVFDLNGLCRKIVRRARLDTMHARIAER